MNLQYFIYETAYDFIYEIFMYEIVMRNFHTCNVPYTVATYEIFTNEIFIYEISDVWNSAYENDFNSNFVIKNM